MRQGIFLCVLLSLAVLVTQACSSRPQGSNSQSSSQVNVPAVPTLAAAKTSPPKQKVSKPAVPTLQTQASSPSIGGQTAAGSLSSVGSTALSTQSQYSQAQYSQAAAVSAASEERSSEVLHNPHSTSSQGAAVETLEPIATVAPSSLATVAATPAPTAKALEIIPVNGSMTIDFSSRVPNSQNEGEARDLYTIQLGIADSLSIRGNIQRKPRVLSRILQTEKQPLELVYDLNFSVFGDPQGASVANWTGALTTDASGRYALHGSEGISNKLRIVARTASSIGGEFGGSIQGKSENSQSSTWTEYTRWITGKKITITAKRTDPLAFKNLILAPGPFSAYPRVRVSGNLDYDYDTGNWLTNGIRMTYSLAGQEITDVITGSIKWHEDPRRNENGKGAYEFNLRFNEQAVIGTPDEGQFFEELSDEEAFFASHSEVPYLGGTIQYQDSFLGSSDEETAAVIKSRITYALQGHGLTKTQMLNFLKLWLLITGPVNDE